MWRSGYEYVCNQAPAARRGRMPHVTLKDLSRELQLGDRVACTGNRPGRIERRRLCAAAMCGIISKRNPWEWNSNDQELHVVRRVLQFLPDGRKEPASGWEHDITKAQAFFATFPDSHAAAPPDHLLHYHQRQRHCPLRLLCRRFKLFQHYLLRLRCQPLCLQAPWRQGAA